MNFVTNWVTDKVASYATTGIQAGGTLAGNAVGGVGTLLENSGRAVGQSANGIAGAIGGVGGYINNYGQQVQNSMAADGPVGGGIPKKKTAVKAITAPNPSTARKPPSGAGRALPSTTKRASSSKRSSPSPVVKFPSKPPPPQTLRNLPSKKPIPATPTVKTSYPPHPPPKARAAAVSSRPPRRFDNSKRPIVSTSQSEKTTDEKVKIAAESRPRAAVKA